ncbi:hypothetical protein PVT67_16855 [Gallaecimonas kandeliae]|uniref:hypothetical protein n=1 Tax=Gallaecimonas kandeliae TaxID=3029055 RepID=UPI0026476C9D|nr:hypothetical protein [Gallaecimonas kandeliae]WKE65312.1 hypothetical protein PVT67_16855 [Gallaecimonas kandeliae]
MAGKSPHPLTPDEAKARLRQAADQASLGLWVGRHPWPVMAAALVGGFVVGRIGVTALARTPLARRFAPVLLRLVWDWRRC